MRNTNYIATALLACATTLFSSTADDLQSRQAASDFARTSGTALAPVYGCLAEYLVREFALEHSGGIGIDLGGGPGRLIVELARRTPSMRWINADINPHFFPYLRVLADSAEVGGRVEGVEADAVELPFPDGYANIVVSRGSYQFWSDLRRGLREVHRVLTPGGTAFIGRGFAPDMPSEAARQVRLAQKGGPSYDPDDEERKLRDAARMLGVRDFEIVRPRPPGGGDTNYGIWLRFRKDGLDTGAILDGRRTYVMDTLVLRGTPPRDPLARPKSEPVGLQGAITVVSAEEITSRGASTLVEALEYVPGAWVETRGRKVKQFFSVRGQRYPYPDYAVDGAWQREFHELPYFFPAHDIEKVEVVRSSAALLKGLSGMNGMVDISLRRLDRNETVASIEYGSFGSYDFNLSHGGSAGPAGYTVSFGVPHTSGPGGRHAAEGLKHFRGSFYLNPASGWSITAHAMHLDGYRELAQALPPAGNRLRGALEEYDPFRSTLITLNALYSHGGRGTSELTLNYADRDHVFISKTSEPHQSAIEHDYEWSANFVQSLALSEHNVLRFGGLYNNWVAPNGKRFYTGRRCDLGTYSAVLVDQHEFGRLTVDAGLRWARTWIDEYGAFNIDGSAGGFETVEQVVDQWEPSVFTAGMGASWALDHGISLLFNLSHGSVKPRAGTLDTGLKTPSTERRTKLDFGVSAVGMGISMLTATGFYVRQDDAIVLSGETETVGGREPELYLNRDQEQLGLELDARSLPIAGRFRLFGNLTAMRSRLRDGGMKKNAELPGLISGAGVYYTSGRVDATLLWKYVSGYESARFAASGRSELLGDFHDLGLTAGYTFGDRPTVRCYAEVRNIGNDRYSTTVGWPDYGRRYTLGARANFF